MKHLFLVLLTGLLMAIAWPTYGCSLFIFIAWIPLLLMEAQLRSTQKPCKGKVFLLSYLSFLVWNTLTTWWIWNSTIVGALFAILVNSLLMSIVFFAYHLVAKRNLLYRYMDSLWEVPSSLGFFLALALLRECLFWKYPLDTVVWIYGYFRRESLGVSSEYTIIPLLTYLLSNQR